MSYALTDSPVGQLAWIVERFKDWTDSTDAPEDAVDRDAMLTNVMIYWLSGTAGSSARYYYEGAATWGQPEPDIDVPVAVAVMPHDIGVPVRRIAEQNHNIVRWTEFDRGGHFAAMEEPDLVVDRPPCRLPRLPQVDTGFGPIDGGRRSIWNLRQPARRLSLEHTRGGGNEILGIVCGRARFVDHERRLRHGDRGDDHFGAHYVVLCVVDHGGHRCPNNYIDDGRDLYDDHHRTIADDHAPCVSTGARITRAWGRHLGGSPRRV